MKQKYSYSLAYIILIGIPTLVLFSLVRDLIDIKALIVEITGGLIIGGALDVWGTRQGKRDRFFVWEYNKKSTLGINLLGVPIEDWIFLFVLMPTLAISLYLFASRIL